MKSHNPEEPEKKKAFASLAIPAILLQQGEDITELLLGGSWAVISRVISPRIWVISTVILLITLPITAHEPALIEPL